MSMNEAGSAAAGRFHDVLRAFAQVAGGVALIAASSKVQVPFWPVPMTLQTLTVILVGASYGLRLGSVTVATYLMFGVLGLPVFAGGGGIACLAGPTAGYLCGFLLAATLIGRLSDRGFCRNMTSTLMMLLVGEVAIFLPGVGWLAVLIGPEKALAGGLYPFILAEILKVLFACVAIRLFKSRSPNATAI